MGRVKLIKALKVQKYNTLKLRAYITHTNYSVTRNREQRDLGHYKTKQLRASSLLDLEPDLTRGVE